ncbi:DNA translocase FtsK 4TM domain-containing protein [Tabrizicola sp.]|uniref:DNA translocase FtsK n=1 Tax=Tabrizicola sp. TaxID=2005166 RepID=UPI002732E4D8|nr:DNA translocase FtsK 4TM domain-containing protein [Tabrizicola sp.]MDP3195995.1 DNA translocase FtsK 4TM domain-containing protein [Tabrizicola sp.]
MASYQARQRDPLLDQGTQAMLERRGRELLGLVLLLAALGFTLMLWSYSPEDPGWMVATEEPAQNMFGRFGAAVASTLIILIGKGAWTIPLIFAAWGLRFMAHRGGERAIGRVVFAVIAVAFAAVHCATLVPGNDWTHTFGLGGLFGDTVTGSLLGMIPGSAGFGLKFLSLLTFGGLIAMMLFVTGFDMDELRTIQRFLLLGSILGYSALRQALGSGARGALSGAAALQDRARTRSANITAARGYEPPAAMGRDVPVSRRVMPPVTGAMAPEPLRAAPARAMPASLRSEPRPAPEPEYAPAPVKEKLGLLERLRRKAQPEPELIEVEPTWDAAMPQEDRIKARISDVIRTRVMRTPDFPVAPPPLPTAARVEPPVMRPKGPVVLMADTRPLPRTTPPAAVPAWEPEVEEDEPLAYTEAAAWDDQDDLADYPLDDLEDELPPARPMVFAPDRKAVVQHAVKKAAPSRQAMAESQPALRFDEPAQVYELPPLNLLTAPVKVQGNQLSDEALEENARMLESVLDDYGVKGEITAVRPGPVVTMYELEPAPGLKASRVIGLADDIARSMSALSARVSTVPGRSVIGIELPNAHREKVVLREILSARDFGDSHLRLPLALGKDIGGEPVVANLAKMPHLLIAGTTGSGKSVAINTMILSLLYKLTPEECRLIMIDPKMLELSVYDGIPHLLSPVVTDPKKAVVALKWVVSEMEERYRKMSKMGVRNIEGYNGRVREALSKNEMFKRTIQTGFDEETGDPVFETEEFAPVTLPYIVVIVDEMADLMMVAGKEIEACIQRLAQMARASGIHLIMATQRPSVDVITGTIKANFPTRISFQVTSKIDSRTILGEQGAEQLLGAGDMLYMGNGAKITRIHGPFVSDEEVEEIVNHLKSFGPPVYMSGVVEGPEDERDNEIDAVLGLNSEGDDTLYDQAVAIVARDRKCSTSYIQRKLGIGYNKAARLVEQMEEEGVVTRANHVGKREILVEER